VSDWFSNLGEPLGVTDERQVGEYLTGLGLIGEFPVESVSDWKSAYRTIADEHWDPRWWEAEQREQDRLLKRVREGVGELGLMRALATSLGSADVTYEAATFEAAKGGCSDVALIRAAAGALSQALYLADLTRLAGMGVSHPFSIKKSLFSGGHWPLGIVRGTYYVF